MLCEQAFSSTLQGRDLDNAASYLNVLGRGCTVTSKTHAEIICTVDFGAAVAWPGYDHLVEVRADILTPWPNNVWYLYWDVVGQGVPPKPLGYTCPGNECATAGGFTLTVYGRDFGAESSALSVEIEVRK